MMPAGRPSKYKPQFVKQAEKLCRLGATDIELADFFGVCETTVYRWSNRYPGFCKALKVGKEEPDNRTERSLYHRANGYSYHAVKIFCQQGIVTEVPYIEHVPPDPVSMIFWLKNRRPDLWRDRHEFTGKVNHAVNRTVTFADGESYAPASANVPAPGIN